MRKSRVVLSLLVALLLSVTLISTQAEATLFSGSSGSLSASANFVLVGPTLTITLTNTSAADVVIPTQVLTALLFSSTGLTPVSALLNGSTVFFGPNGGGNVGGEWEYLAASGISSAGFGVFGNPNFNGLNLTGPNAIDGLQYGITSAGDNPATGNAEVTGNQALIQNHVVFTLTSNGTFTMPESVVFQYGTALTDNHFGTPEPSTMLLFGAGLVGIGFLRKRFKK